MHSTRYGHRPQRQACEAELRSNQGHAATDIWQDESVIIRHDGTGYAVLQKPSGAPAVHGRFGSLHQARVAYLASLPKKVA